MIVPRALTVLVTAVSLLGPASRGQAQPTRTDSVQKPAAPSTLASHEALAARSTGEVPARLEFQGVRLATYRSRVANLSPADRVQTALRRLESLRPPFAPVRDIAFPGGRSLFVGDVFVFSINEVDLDIRLGATVERDVAEARAGLEEALRRRAAQFTVAYRVRAVIFSLLATLAAALLFGLLLRGYRTMVRMLAAESERHVLSIGGFDISGPIVQSIRWVIRVACAAGACLVAYAWVTFVLNRFPATQPSGRAARSLVLETFRNFATGTVGALPGLFTVAVILLLTRWLTGLLDDFFTAIERRTIAVPGIHPETTSATRRLVRALVWLFAVVLAYPYLPGSGSVAFQGVSVFVGLLVTLGSAGVVGHIMSGLVLVYSRALRKGDYVRIGDVEGTVIEVGALATKLTNPRNEEFTIPNTVMVATTIKNFTRLAADVGAPVTTTVTIGYDAPWRVVHDMLLSAAARTPGLRRQPEPIVLQLALSDFYVEYQLVARLEIPERRLFVLSQLHQNIQDAFNERGVQIMSPHFEGQPDRPVVVPKSKWHVPSEGERRPE